MPRRSLLHVTWMTVVLTGVVLPHTRWSLTRSGRLHSSGAAASHCAFRSRDPLASDAAWRWRQCQPTHWRSCLLQH